VEFNPTRIATVDNAIGGGFPKGRIVEIFGHESSAKTTLALYAVAEAQRTGGVCAFLDIEHALNPAWAKMVGVDTDELLISQPNSGEEAWEIALALAESNEIDIVVVDSVSTLIPMAEVEGDMTDANMGTQAKMMSKGLRKLGALNTKTTTIFINQIRNKIGVVYGCFNYNARVRLANGTSEKIGKIVNQKLELDILTFNQATGSIEPQRVVGWHDNGTTPGFLQITTSKDHANGASSFGVTDDHVIMTPEGETRAKDLSVGDYVMSRTPDRKFNEDQWQIVLGSLLGDGCLVAKKTKARLRLGHGPKQTSYLLWKGNILNAEGPWIDANKNGEMAISSNHLMAFASLQGRKYTKARIPYNLINGIEAKGISIWYMDDGSLSGSHDKWGAGKATISVKSMPLTSRIGLAERCMKLGLGSPHISSTGILMWTGEDARLFFNGIGAFVPESMRYKLPSYSPKYSWEPDSTLIEEDLLVPQEVLSVKPKPKTRSMKRFDISVENNHNYFVDEVLVHNSPEVTSGGMALKFHASLRIRTQLKGAKSDRILDEHDMPIGVPIELEVRKNKCAPPFRTARFDLYYESGIDLDSALLDEAVIKEIVIKKGSHYYDANGEKLGQGRENVRAYFKEHPETVELIRKKIYEEQNTEEISEA